MDVITFLQRSNDDILFTKDNASMGKFWLHRHNKPALIYYYNDEHTSSIYALNGVAHNTNGHAVYTRFVRCNFIHGELEESIDPAVRIIIDNYGVDLKVFIWQCDGDLYDDFIKMADNSKLMITDETKARYMLKYLPYRNNYYDVAGASSAIDSVLDLYKDLGNTIASLFPNE